MLLLSLGLGPTCSSHASGRYDGQPLPSDVSIDRIVVYKSEGVMEVWSNDTLLKVYSISVGVGGDGPKRYEGDRHTPEGTYKIDSRHVSQNYHRFLHVSYPNEDDSRAYELAVKEGSIPADVKIGGAIGIHGERAGWQGWPHKWFDWTAGCIAVDNDEIEELYETVQKNATLVIHP